ncbi:hypothetical protein STTU_3223 [Streptomyces sp. Tu6071]|nr:hypothetical protein STTU_3223 [Streptomyces sp. Tu6071]
MRCFDGRSGRRELGVGGVCGGPGAGGGEPASGAGSREVSGRRRRLMAHGSPAFGERGGTGLGGRSRGMAELAGAG